MDQLPALIPTSPLGNTLNRMIGHASSNKLTSGGDDIEITKDAHGTVIRLTNQYRNPTTAFLNYKSEWSASAGYGPNAVVRVSTQTEASSSKGVWICVNTVPDKDISDILKTQGITSANCDLVREDGVNYNPIWPEPTTNRYWEILSLLPVEAHTCINGTDSIYYIGAIKSGSLTI